MLSDHRMPLNSIPLQRQIGLQQTCVDEEGTYQLAVGRLLPKRDIGVTLSATNFHHQIYSSDLHEIIHVANWETSKMSW